MREPDAPIYGSMSFLIEGYNLDTVGSLDRVEVRERLVKIGAQRPDSRTIWIARTESRSLHVRGPFRIEL